MELKDLDGDLPAALVERYRESSKPYADEGRVWIPFIAESKGHVWRTANGFEARSSASLGPLGLAILASTDASYSEDGSLESYAVSTGCIWGLLWSESRAKSGFHRFVFLKGLLGYERSGAGARTFYLLYMPIPFGGGCDERAGTADESRRHAPEEADETANAL